MAKRLGYFLFVLKVALTVCEETDYCNIFCGQDNRHTMCAYPPGGGQECKKYKKGLTSTEERFIMNIHNAWRRDVHKTPRHAQMADVLWDVEAADVAQRWADQCKDQGSDSCRPLLDGENGSQNVAIFCSKTFKRREFIEHMVDSWFVESEYEKKNAVTKTPRKKMGGQYSLVVRVGCGISATDPDRKRCSKLVCNYYYPPRNSTQKDRTV